MMDNHYLLIEKSIKRAYEKKGDVVLAQLFFDRFFTHYPETRQFFKTTDIASFGPKKIRYISDFLIDTVKHADYAETQIITEVMRHQVYGLKDKEYYYMLLDVFHESVRDCLADEWSDEIEECWSDVVLAVKAQVYEATKDFLYKEKSK
jgi:hemoglobin-like flavoprotein